MNKDSLPFIISNFRDSIDLNFYRIKNKLYLTLQRNNKIVE